MPPKRKAAEKGDELEHDRETSERELAITSPISSASSYSTASSDSSRSCGTVSAEQLERILDV